MLKMSTVLVKADLDSASKVIDNSDALLLWHSVDLLRYCFLELRDGRRIVPVHIILQEPPQVDIWGVRSGEWGDHSGSRFRLMSRFENL